MTLSIIIPTYNEATNIGELISQLQRDTASTEVELLVVDGGSTDQSFDIAIRAGAKAVVSPHRGRAAQMNHGASLATGDTLYFVHADTRPPQHFQKDIEQALKEGYLAGCYRFRFDSTRWLLRINSFFTRFNTLTVRGGDQTLFIDRRVFVQLGGFDEQFVIMEEYDFLRRLWKKHPNKFKLIPRDVVVSARKYDNNGWLRVQLANLTAMICFRLGVAPARIAKIYKKMLVHK